MADITTVDGKHYDGVRPQHHPTGVWFSYSYQDGTGAKQNMFFIPYQQIARIVATADEYRESNPV